TAVITGGASGIGFAIAELFASEGAPVAVWDRSPAAADAAGRIATQFKVPALGLEVDVTDGAALRDALAQTTSRLGPIEHLAHAAAIGSGKFGFPFTNLSPDDWHKTLAAHIMGMVQVAHAGGPGMIEPR